LMVSVGGAAGGLFVALLAPHLFPTYMELPIAVAGCAWLATFALWYDGSGSLRPLWLRYSLLILTAGFSVYLGRNEATDQSYYRLNTRNFYGVLHVRDDPPDLALPGIRVLVHGTINHGTELQTPGGGRIATSYFGRGSGVSRAIRAK